MPSVTPPRGMRDFLPAEKARREHVLGVIRRTFRAHGFDEVETTVPTLALTLNLAQREGGFPLTPRASLTDGLLDYLHATDLRRWHLVRYLPAMALGRLPENHPLLKLGQCTRVTVKGEAPLCVHADGEFFCLPEDNIHDISVEVLPARLMVEVFRPAMYGQR